ncbi:MAG: outer membrane beta-barrel protein [Colwellia sp.]
MYNMNKAIRLKKSLLSAAIATLICSNAYAVEPLSIPLESGVIVTPLVETGVKYDNNIFSDATSSKSSSILTIDPSVNFLLEDGANAYNIDVAIQSGVFFSSSADNYLDAELGFDVHLEPSSQSRYDIIGEANWKTEARGTGIAEGQSDNISAPITYAEQKLGASYEYGALSTPARISVDANYYNKGYSNFKDITKYRDYSSFKLGSTFYYSTRAFTDALLEVSLDNIDYSHTAPLEATRDSKDYRILGGVQWEATALTSGAVKIGYQEKDFKDASREKFSGLSWDANVQWQPLTYSTLDFSTSRAARDPNVEGDYIKESVYAVSWQHVWDEKISTDLSTAYLDEDYTGVRNARKDETLTLTAAVDYAFDRWMDISFYTEFTDKDSTRDEILYDKTVVGVNFIIVM